MMIKTVAVEQIFAVTLLEACTLNALLPSVTSLAV